MIHTEIKANYHISSHTYFLGLPLSSETSVGFTFIRRELNRKVSPRRVNSEWDFGLSAQPLSYLKGIS